MEDNRRRCMDCAFWAQYEVTYEEVIEGRHRDAPETVCICSAPVPPWVEGVHKTEPDYGADCDSFCPSWTMRLPLRRIMP